MLWEMAGLTPQQVARAKEILAAEKSATPPSTEMIPAAGGGRNGAPVMAMTGVQDAMEAS